MRSELRSRVVYGVFSRLRKAGIRAFVDGADIRIQDDHHDGAFLVLAIRKRDTRILDACLELGLDTHLCRDGSIVVELRNSGAYERWLSTVVTAPTAP